MLNSSVYLCEVHTQTNLRKQMHDDALVLLHRLALGVIIPVVMAIKQLWNQHQRSVTRLEQRRVQTCMFYFFTCIRGAIGHGWVERLCGVWPFQSRFFITEGWGGRRPWGTDEEIERVEMHQEAEIRQAAKELKFMSRLSTKLYLLPVEFYLCSADNREEEEGGQDTHSMQCLGEVLLW